MHLKAQVIDELNRDHFVLTGYSYIEMSAHVCEAITIQI